MGSAHTKSLVVPDQPMGNANGLWLESYTIIGIGSYFLPSPYIVSREDSIRLNVAGTKRVALSTSVGQCVMVVEQATTSA